MRDYPEELLIWIGVFVTILFIAGVLRNVFVGIVGCWLWAVYPIIRHMWYKGKEARKK